MKYTQYYTGLVIHEVIEEGQNLNRAIKDVVNYAIEQHGETLINRPAIQEASYGVLRHLQELNLQLNKLLDKPVQPERVRNLLIVALYQLQYSHYREDKTYVIVDSAVRCVDELFHRRTLKGFVNAILRNYLRRKDELKFECHNYPHWWVKKLKTDYPDQWEHLLNHGNQRPPMTLRVNLSKISREDYVNTHLIPANIEFDLVDESAIVLKTPIDVKKLPLFDQGFVSVQDAGAQFAGYFLPITKEKANVLDACSAPGGKTIHLLERYESLNINLTAIDLDNYRLDQVEDNLDRLNSPLPVNLAYGDASDPEFLQHLVKKYNPNNDLFDYILADVPCSASGVVRRHPDIKWLRRAEDVASFATQQKEILQNLWSFLAENGFLLYVTCSIFNEENNLQIQQFIEQNPNAKLCDLPTTIQFPAPDNTHDGFYYALLQKISTS